VADLTYSNRHHVLASEYSHRLGPDALEWSDGVRRNAVAYAKILSVHLYRLPDIRTVGSETPGAVRCRLQTTRGDAVTFGSVHHLSASETADRSDEMRRFLAELIRRVAAARPDAIFVHGMPPMRLGLGAALLLALPAAVVLALVARAMSHDAPLDLAAVVTVAGCLVVLINLAMPVAHLLHRHRPRRFDPAGTDWHDVWNEDPAVRPVPPAERPSWP